MIHRSGVWQIYLVVLCLGPLFAAGCSSATTSRKATPEEQAEMYVNAANASLVSGEPMLAMEDLAKAQQLAPDMPELYHTRALADVVRDDNAAAIVDAKKAIELNPNFSAANNTLGKLLMDSGKPNEAIPYLEKAAGDSLYHDVSKPLTNLGILYYRRTQFDKAAYYLDHAIAAEPRSACIAYYYRGHLHLQRAEFKAAIHDYDQATRRFCTDFAEAHLALGIAYERSKQYVDARKKFLEIQDRFSDTAVAEQAKGYLNTLP